MKLSAIIMKEICYRQQ